MPKTAMYRSQHRELLTLVEAVPVDGPVLKPLDVQLALARLRGVLNVHLTLEDKNLYPAMLAHESDLIRVKAQKYQREMGSLAGTFTDFYVTWTQAGAIETQPAAFSAAWAQVRRALLARIEAEETDLYDAVDAYVDLPAAVAAR